MTLQRVIKTTKSDKCFVLLDEPLDHFIYVFVV